MIYASGSYALYCIQAHDLCPDIPIIVIGTKKDLRDDPQTIWELKMKKQKPVSEEEGRITAARIGSYFYLECSAKTKDVCLYTYS